MYVFLLTLTIYMQISQSMGSVNQSVALFAFNTEKECGDEAAVRGKTMTIGNDTYIVGWSCVKALVTKKDERGISVSVEVKK